MLVMTFFHPASTFNFAYSSLLSASFLMFSLALSTFSSSFLARNSSSCRLPSSFRLCFYSHSRYYNNP